MTEEQIKKRDDRIRELGWKVVDTLEELFEGTPLGRKVKKGDTVSLPVSVSKKKSS